MGRFHFLVVGEVLSFWLGGSTDHPAVRETKFVMKIEQEGGRIWLLVRILGQYFPDGMVRVCIPMRQPSLGSGDAGGALFGVAASESEGEFHPGTEGRAILWFQS